MGYSSFFLIYTVIFILEFFVHQFYKIQKFLIFASYVLFGCGGNDGDSDGDGDGQPQELSQDLNDFLQKMESKIKNTIGNINTEQLKRVQGSVF